MRPDDLWPAARTETWILAPARTFEDRGTYGLIRTPSNPTFRWGNCLVLPAPPDPAALDALEALHAAQFPARTVPAFYWAADAVEGPIAAALAARGYHVEVELSLTMGRAGLPAPTLPAGVRVEPVRSVAEWAEFVRFRLLLWPDLPVDYQLQRAAMGWRSAQANAGDWWLMWRDGAVIGSMGLFWRDGVARYQDVDVLADHRGQGLGRAMFHTVRARSEAAGDFATQLIVADRGSQAHAWYERMGFQPETGECFAFLKQATTASAKASAAPEA